MVFIIHAINVTFIRIVISNQFYVNCSTYVFYEYKIYTLHCYWLGRFATSMLEIIYILHKNKFVTKI
jgi:hypothetical protein